MKLGNYQKFGHQCSVSLGKNSSHKLGVKHTSNVRGKAALLKNNIFRAVASMKQKRQMPPLDLIFGDTIRASGFASIAGSCATA